MSAEEEAEIQEFEEFLKSLTTEDWRELYNKGEKE